jgi:hypothetical protein
LWTIECSHQGLDGNLNPWARFWDILHECNLQTLRCRSAKIRVSCRNWHIEFGTQNLDFCFCSFISMSFCGVLCLFRRFYRDITAGWSVSDSVSVSLFLVPDQYFVCYSTSHPIRHRKTLARAFSQLSRLLFKWHSLPRNQKWWAEKWARFCSLLVT